MSHLIAFVRDERGATSIEYATFASLIALVLIGTANALGGTVKNSYVIVSKLF